MIAYFDTSAIIPVSSMSLLSNLSYRLWRRSSWIATARVSYIEARAGLTHACRTGHISPEKLREAGDLAEEVALRAYDAIHLAAALSMDMDDAVVVTGNRHLAATARAHGLASISDPKTRV